MAKNLFAKAAKETIKEAKRPTKGTVIELPRDLDDQGKLRGDSKKLNEAITDLIAASREEKTAKQKAGIAKSVLGRYCHPEVVRRLAKDGVMPATPIKIANHNSESVTYVLTDKSQQYPLKEEQVSELTEIFGEDGMSKVVESKDVYSFNSSTMDELAVSGQETVADVIFELVSDAITNCDRITDEQKESLIDMKNVTLLKRNMASLAPELCGRDATKIEELFDICSSQLTRYLKP